MVKDQMLMKWQIRHPKGVPDDIRAFVQKGVNEVCKFEDIYDFKVSYKLAKRKKK